MTGNPVLDPFAIAGVIASGLGLLFILARIWRRVRALAQRVEDFLEDWNGTPARPGVPARAGVMARLERVEERLARVEHETTDNSGGSLKDAVRRVEQHLRGQEN